MPPSPTSARWRACRRTTRILMLQGGASLQFSMVPMNLLTPGTTADYIDTGSWAEKAAKEAARVGTVNVTGSTKADNYNRLPKPGEIALTPGAAYVHITTNNTIEGTEWPAPPDVGARAARGRRLVRHLQRADRRQPVRAHLRAAPRRTSGPSGVTLVIIREDLLARSSKCAADDAELPGDGREQLALQHAQHLRRLHPGPDDAVAEVARRPEGHRRAEREKGGDALCARSIARASTGEPRSRTAGRA